MDFGQLAHFNYYSTLAITPQSEFALVITSARNVRTRRDWAS
jgi:hypothetical protein